MATWVGPYRCTDCGKEIEKPGTCTKCQAANQPETEKPGDR